MADSVSPEPSLSSPSNMPPALPPKDNDSGVYSLDAVAPVTGEDRVVEHLSRVTRAGSIHGALEIGELIFREVFQSDEQHLRSRGKKGSSLRKLASDPRLNISATTLCRCVAIYELSLRFPELRSFTHVGVGHVSVVLGFTPASQTKLLARAEAEHWSRGRLQAEAAKHERARQGGRPPQPAIVRELRSLESLMKDSSRHLKSASLQELSASDIAALQRSVERIRSRCDELQGVLSESN